MSVIWIPRPLHTQTHTHTQTLGSYLENKICLRHGNNAKTKEWTIRTMSKLTSRKTSDPLRIYLAIKTRISKKTRRWFWLLEPLTSWKKTTEKIYWGDSKRFLNLNLAKFLRTILQNTGIIACVDFELELLKYHFTGV